MKDNNFYYDSVYDTSESRMEKIQKQRKFFSRIFLGLFIYLLCFNFLPTLIFIIAGLTLPQETYVALINNKSVVMLTSSLTQYLVALPIFFLIVRDMNTSEKKEGKKLSLSEWIILFSAAELFMLVGNMIGTFLNSAIGTFINKTPENGLEEILESTPIWLTFVVMVVIAPIVEELVFRKLLIDRLSIYGDHVAILFSAVAFGLMHANLYQLFYATLLGALFGYVYTCTRNVKYTIALHAAVNFLGSTVILLLAKIKDYVSIFTQNALIISLAEELATLLYSTVQSGLIIAGAIVLVYRSKNREIRVSRDTEIYIPTRDIVKNGVSNYGSILFIATSIFLMVLSLFN